MKTQLFISHPDIHRSTTQQFLKATASNEEGINIVHLDEEKEFAVDYHRELIKKADRLILQFPLYWYSCPYSMKKWIDEVLTTHLVIPNQIKELGIVVNVGKKATAYQAGGSERFTLSEFLRPFEAISHILGWKYLSPFVIYQFDYMSEPQKQQMLVDYLRYLTQEDYFSTKAKEDWFIKRANQYAYTTNESINYFEFIQTMKENQDTRLELEWMVKEMKE